MEKTFPRLVQTGEGSSINSTGCQIYGENPPPSGSDGGRFLHKLEMESNLWRTPMGEGSSISSIPNKIQHKSLETRVMVNF